ncbi:1-aminocyclopropane-1-carboxylate oxidase homolog 1-like isoform X2 [Malania oleifera]|uniref:1-aminocyclopropane-1-carboxylate oxidase homolog 1-like isoform X2 n=1 Tax=Malania oleifera TaxID=397392 RepID=UPI0025AE3E79|nr:1-aminocyclopropane-1-carboxylate oxidase homolog 1-like isoform X2 [Malania oleifera]
MEVTCEVGGESIALSGYDRAKEVEEFDQTKAGVKGLVDAGVVKIPRFFIHPTEKKQEKSSSADGGFHLQVPVIDFQGIETSRRREVVSQIGMAAETWGFFQILNHGVPLNVTEEMLKGVRQFHEQPMELKMELYSRDPAQPVRYYCNGDLHVSGAANWRDSIACDFYDDTMDCKALPLACREAIVQYMNCIFMLRNTLSDLLSEALGLSSNFLAHMECMKSESLVCHYYPACPEPDLTLGTTKHSDPSFLTILLQDKIGGLQVLHQDQWVDVPPIQGALVVNMGDLVQLITNDKFRSVEHRVLAGRIGPRVSAACFFYPSTAKISKPYGPIKEFTSDSDPPIYRETSLCEYLAYYRSKGLDGNSALPYFRL